MELAACFVIPVSRSPERSRGIKRERFAWRSDTQVKRRDHSQGAVRFGYYRGSHTRGNDGWGRVFRSGIWRVGRGIERYRSEGCRRGIELRSKVSSTNSKLPS